MTRHEAMAKHTKNDVEVGYGKPPKGTRFKKGQSGNPSGRPKKGKTQQFSAKMSSKCSNSEPDRRIEERCVIHDMENGKPSLTSVARQKSS
jgi:hypothetical protein